MLAKYYDEIHKNRVHVGLYIRNDLIHIEGCKHNLINAGVEGQNGSDEYT